MAGVVDQDFDFNSVAAVDGKFLRRILLLEILRNHTDVDAVISPELGRGLLEFGLDWRDDDERMAVPRQIHAQDEVRFRWKRR